MESIKVTLFPCWVQYYAEKVNKFSIYDYLYVLSYENSVLSAPCLLTRALLPISRVVFPSLWCILHTGASRGPRCRNIGSEYIAHIGRMALD